MQNPVEIIHTANNLTIELGPTSWRLLNGSYPSDTPVALLEARQDRIVCSPAFARARQLPGDGQLTPADVARVVVGWAPESQSWHLGMLLAARPDTNFKMQWCGLASWPSGQSAEYLTQSKLAGQSLARIMDRPFHLIPPPSGPVDTLSETQPLQPTVQMAPPDSYGQVEIKLQDPPFSFEEWELVAVPKGYVWQRRSGWLWQIVLRGVFAGVLAALFLALGIGSETSGLAPVNPGWLPLLGIGVAVMLALLALYYVKLLLSTTDILIDTIAREVRCRNRFLSRVLWRVPFDSIEYLVVSQTPTQALGRRSKDQPMRTLQDVWLHLYDGSQFWLIAGLSSVEGQCHDWENTRKIQKRRGRRPLRIDHYDTPAHHAALWMAHIWGIDTWLDVC
jgi:hypothetical protein